METSFDGRYPANYSDYTSHTRPQPYAPNYGVRQERSAVSYESSGGLSGSAQRQIACLIVGLALTALAAIGSYYCFTRGFPMLDMARTGLQEFGGASLIYMGLTFSAVAVVNFLYSGGKVGFHKGGNFVYSAQDAKEQILISVFAPIALIPAIFCCALGGGKR